MKRYISILGIILFVIIISLSLFVDFNLTNNGYTVRDDLVKKVVYTESQEKQTKDVLDLRGINNAFVSIAKRVIPAVVSINTEKKVKISSRENPFEFFFFPFGRGDDKERERRFQGLGSGMIISSDGYILTNKHVIDNVDKRRVQLTDKRTYEAEVVGFDNDTDIALLKIDAEGLPIVILGNSDEVEVGQLVLAIGSPLSPNLSSTVTAGIVSGIGRNIDIDRTNRYSIENYIQTDAAINPGNSGGPLLNINGEVIGINTAIMSRSGYNLGYAFAIPINIVKNVVSDLKGHGKVTRGYIGISIGDIQDTDDMEAFGLDKPEGVIVQGFTPGSAAENAGLESGDVIIEVDGKKVARRNELQSIITGKDPGDEVTLSVIRGGVKKYITVTLRARSEEGTGLIAATPNKDKKEMPDIGISVEMPSTSTEYYKSSGIKKKGVVIADVNDDSQAFQKGLSKGDLIWKIGSIEIKSESDFKIALEKYKGKAAQFFIVRQRTGDTSVLSLRIPN